MTPEQLARSGTEDGEQRALFAYAADRVNGRSQMPGQERNGIVYQPPPLPPEPLWALLYAIPNGGKRDPRVGAMLKTTGTKAGFPDVGLPVARGGRHGLFIELKRVAARATDEAAAKRAGTVGKLQSPWLAKLNEQGYLATVCYGWLESVALIESYLSERNPF